MNTNNGLSIWSNGMGPFGELRREVDRFLNDYGAASVTRSARLTDSEWSPACEVEEAEDYYLLTLEMPGIAKEQIKIETIDNQILISGERRSEKKTIAEGAWYSERRFGKFHRNFTLPAGVSADKVEASYQEGMLRVYVPKAETAKPRQIKISNGSGAGLLSKLIGQSSMKEKEERHAPSELNSDRVA